VIESETHCHNRSQLLNEHSARGEHWKLRTLKEIPASCRSMLTSVRVFGSLVQLNPYTMRFFRWQKKTLAVKALV
jgi:hypothetical protein